MHPPLPHGINPNFKINEAEAKKHKLYKSIIVIPELAKNALNNNPKSDKKTYDKFKATFKTISKRFIQQPALVRFTKLLVEYMDLETTRNKFNDAIEEAVLDNILIIEEEKSRKRIKIIQTQTLNQELSAEISCSSTVAEKDENDTIANDLTNITGQAADETGYIQKIIYGDAEKLHDRYKESDDLTPVERKRMCAGLSGMLDISDSSYHSQRLLFGTSKWKNINEYYSRFRQSFFHTKLDSNLNSLYEIWDTIHKALTTDHNFFQARRTFNRLSSENDINEYVFKQLQIIDYFLDTFDNKQFVLNPKDPMKLTERDYESQIWVPLFTKLFNIKKNLLVRIKTGESVPEESTKRKAEQYENDKNVIGFKVDLRLIHDHKKLEIDLASTEVALSCADEVKLCHNESKIIGLTAVFSKVLYDDEYKIYVNVYQFTFHFPTCISELEDLKDNLELLFKFKEDTERIASKVQKALKHAERQYHCSEDFPPERKLAPEPPIYFTPPRNEARRSVLPFKGKTL
ncbi:uncharacterized protein B0P05DRAFT_528784 [Gilbertella persicaria]|uniref:uncharacterized protein n=1 Tax=Gilbertella persicaria TaxID=101096 RepID=UPI00221F4FCB|nr:uncharacterized protein B0P05DRAFT_528784 [Gilbertella persicaria]KAI8091096.1 hypothetical protein B0P05DRAFT_528784 [Gilbertella persicaria]